MVWARYRGTGTCPIRQELDETTGVVKVGEDTAPGAALCSTGVSFYFLSLKALTQSLPERFLSGDQWGSTEIPTLTRSLCGWLHGPPPLSARNGVQHIQPQGAGNDG